MKQALSKPEIDEVIKISEGYFDDSSSPRCPTFCPLLTRDSDKVVYKFQQDQRLIEAPVPPRAPTIISAPSEIAPEDLPRGEIIETITTKIIENPRPEDYLVPERGARSVHRSGASISSSRSSSSQATARPQGVNDRTVVAEIVADTPVIVPARRKSVRSRAKSAGSGSGSDAESKSALVVSRRKSVRSKDIKAEIRNLEAEQRRLEREERGSKSENRRESRAEGGRPDTVLRVEKDKRGRLSLVRPTT